MWVRTDIVVTEMFIVDSDLQTCISLLLVLGLIVSTHWGSLLLLLVWHAPLGVRSAKRRHQSPEWTILSHSYRRIQ